VADAPNSEAKFGELNSQAKLGEGLMLISGLHYLLLSSQQLQQCAEAREYLLRLFFF
jgi:hypothetical protein